MPKPVQARQICRQTPADLQLIARGFAFAQEQAGFALLALAPDRPEFLNESTSDSEKRFGFSKPF
jgi:hypothetical protein